MASFTQSYGGSCGAVCLMCAAIELNIRQIRTLPPESRYMHWPIVAPIDLDTNEQCERIIYNATGQNGGPGDPGNWGYSMPSDIVITARRLGLRAEVISYETNSLERLTGRYPEEVPLLKLMMAHKPEAGQHSPDRPAWGRREIRALWKGRWLHYILVRPDGTAMDPANGSNYESVHQAKRPFLGTTVMHGTGVSIQVWR